MKRSARYSLEKVQGLLFGIFIGDAIGAAFDGRAPELIPPLTSDYIRAHPAHSYTDDTQLCISVFEEMLEHNGIDQHSLSQRILNRFAACRGYGGGLLEVIEKWKDGGDLEAAARSLYDGLGSFGDGAAVRASPLSAFFSLQENKILFEQVKLSSLITHTHPYGISGALLQAYGVLLALNDIPPAEWLQRFFPLPIESAFKIKFEAIRSCLDRHLSPLNSSQEIGNTAAALNAVPAAIYSVLRHPLPFPDAVLCAVSMGGDADTIGAMAGALSGAFLGINGIPQEWLAGLENDHEGKDFILSLARTASPKP